MLSLYRILFILLGWFLLPAADLQAGALPRAGAVKAVAQKVGLTEGPVMNSRNELFFTDLSSSRILRWTPEEGTTVVRQNSGHANGLAFDPEGRLIMCEQQTRQITRLEPDGRITVLAAQWEGRPLNHPNDLAVDQQGTVYFSDPPGGDLPAAVYELDAKGQLQPLPHDFVSPNGVALSPDESILYVADMGDGKVWALDLAGGQNSKTLLTAAEAPDGLAVDPKGNVYIAEFSRNRIRVVTPGGKDQDFIAIPDYQTRNCVVNSRGDRLYVASGAAIYEIELSFPGEAA